MTLRSPLQHVLATAAVAALGFVAAPALASPEYPEAVQEHLGMPCAPQCTICHRDNRGGISTATKPFAEALKDPDPDCETCGLVKNDVAKVGPALDIVRDKGFDSDDDGMGDIEELTQGRDPNVAGAGVLCATYGCGAHVAPEPADPAAGGAALLVLVGLVASLRLSARRR